MPGQLREWSVAFETRRGRFDAVGTPVTATDRWAGAVRYSTPSAQGNEYLRRAFAPLDFIRQARVVREWK